MWLADFVLQLLYSYVHRQVARWLAMATAGDANDDRPPTEAEVAAARQLDQRLLSLMSTESQPTQGDDEKTTTDDDIVHIQISYLDSKQKRLCLIPLQVSRTMNVADVKQLLCSAHHEKVNNPSSLSFVFMGRHLADNANLSTFDLGDQSIMHVIDDASHHIRQAHQLEPSEGVALLKKKLTTIEAVSPTLEGTTTSDSLLSSSPAPPPESPTNPSGKLYFFIYCTDCGHLSNGKLRIICAKCRQGSVVCHNRPEEWNEILMPNSIRSTCYTPDCGGEYALCYFKCIDDSKHSRTAATNDHLGSSVQPLSRIRHNTIGAPCLSCYDTIRQTVLVFPCDHVICVDCFLDYCRSFLSERRFMLQPVAIDFREAKSIRDQLSYTTNCPLDCSNSWLETKYFRLLDERFYSLYRKFAHEETVLASGGIFCPYPDCEAAFYPDEMMAEGRRSQCQLVQCDSCHYFYCINCTRKGQYESVFCSYEKNIEQMNEEVRGRATTSAKASAKAGDPKMDTEPSTSYLRTLLDKFTSIRVGVDRKEQAKWLDTLSRNKIRETAKPCPRCRTPTERNGGCMHMVCTRNRCNFSWCWICEVEWNHQCLSTHWFG